METIREIIEKNSGKTLDLFTSDGYLMVTPEVGKGLLRQEPANMNPGCSGCNREFPAEMVLAMRAISVAPDEKNVNLLHIMAD